MTDSVPIGFFQIPKGKITATVYGLIRDQRHADAIKLLQNEKTEYGGSRALLSLLGHCQYYSEDFESACLT